MPLYLVPFTRATHPSSSHPSMKHIRRSLFLLTSDFFLRRWLLKTSNNFRFHGNTATIDFPEEIHQFLSDLLFAKKIFNGIELFRVEIYPLIPTDLNRRSFLHSIYVIEFKISRSVLDHLEELDLNDPKREEIDYWYRKYACETLVEYELTD